jgi:hypothetical protein
MVTSVHLAEVGPAAALRLLRRPPAVGEVPGLTYAVTLALAPLGPALLPKPKPGRVGLLAAWTDDAALDAFLADHPTAAALQAGYRARLEPVRVVGAWPELGDLPPQERPAGDGPVAVLTLGRLRLRRAIAFLRASAAAERDALASPALLLATGLARPPRLVATFSVWRDVPTMRGYVRRGGGGHLGASSAHAAKPFHHASAFIRLRLREQTGAWETPH